MGFRFRKSVKLIPGVRLNLGKRGASVSVGGKGLTYNISKKGTRTTVGVPGTGVSYSSYKPNKGQRAVRRTNPTLGWIVLAFLAVALMAMFK